LKFKAKEFQNDSDLSVRTEDAEDQVKNPEKLKNDLHEVRREKDRLEHEVFGLEEDKNSLEQDKENLIDEIEKNEHMVNNLKDHIANLDVQRMKLEDKIESLGGVQTPEQAFQIKHDYHKKLHVKLDEI
jgi:chromosome segregation ATPase